MAQSRFSLGTQDDFQSLWKIFLDKEREIVCIEALAHFLDGLLNVVAIFQIYGHTAHIAFVYDGSCISLDNNRISQVIGSNYTLFSRGHHGPFCRRNAI